MTFRNLTSVEETILKRSFNNWGIFEVFGSLRILIRNLGLDTAISDQKTNISKHDSISNKILNYNSCGNGSSNTVEKYNNNNQGPFHTPTTRYSNDIEFAESKKNIKRTEVFVHSNVKYDNVLFKKLNPVIIGL